MRRIMGKLKLTVNEEKTRVCRVPEEEFDFLSLAEEEEQVRSDLSDFPG